MTPRTALVVTLMLAALSRAVADDTGDAAAQGHALAQQLLNLRPAKDFATTGTLNIRDGSGRKTELPTRFETRVTADGWQSVYEAGDKNINYLLYIIHTAGRPAEYYYSTNQAALPAGNLPALESPAQKHQVAADEMTTAFAGSDFWIGDLGAGFLRWPEQKLIKKEVKRTRGCSVLESTNPHPTAGGYSRVVSWIDTETGGVVQAFAYDVDDRLLKEFYPKDAKKINDQWQIGMMEMDNDPTGSRTRLEFNLDDSGSPQK